MKNRSILYALSVLLLATACKKQKKDTIPGDDIASLKQKLEGIWLFPTLMSKVVDSTGKVLVPDFYIPDATALKFGANNQMTQLESVDLRYSSEYSLYKKNGVNWLDWGNGSTFRIQTLNDTLLEMTDTIKANTGRESDRQIYFFRHSRMKPADTSGKARVWIKSDSVNSIVTLITPAVAAGQPAKPTVVVNRNNYIMQSQWPFTYIYDHDVKPGEKFSLKIDCSLTKSWVYVYYKGLVIYDYRSLNHGFWIIVSNNFPEHVTF